jgi:transposase
MNLDMFTTYDIVTAISSSCNKNEQMRHQNLFLVENGLNPAKVAEDFSVHCSTVNRRIKQAKNEGFSALNAALIEN